MNEQEKLPLDGFRGPLPLSNADFDAIRANVLSRIGTVRRPWLAAFPLRFATGTVAVALVAVLLVVSWPHETAPSRQVPQRAAAAPKPVTIPSITTPAVEPAAAALPPKHVPKPHHAHRPVEPPPVAIAADVHEPMTIELQTSNPDVRIIWITR